MHSIQRIFWTRCSYHWTNFTKCRGYEQDR
jgi:hypothetical protein